MICIEISRRAARRSWCQSSARIRSPVPARCSFAWRRLVSIVPMFCSGAAHILRHLARATFRASKSPARSRALGDGVDGWRVGDAVCALLVSGGGYATMCVAPATSVSAGAGCDRPRGGRGHPRDVLHRLDERVRPRASAGGGDGALSRWIERHRHDRYSTRCAPRRDRATSRSGPTRRSAPARRSAPSARSTIARRTSSR